MLGIFVIYLILLVLHLLSHGDSISTGFWYGGEVRKPETQYDSLEYANMTVKVDVDIHEGPGQNLVTDPTNPAQSLYVGNTINRQSFDTQFILDLRNAIGIEENRIYVTHVSKGIVHFTWESTSVIVEFIILERDKTVKNYNTSSMTLLQAVAKLTEQIQQPGSQLYNKTLTKVACDINKEYGLVIRTWDLSMKLSYAIEVVGGSAVKDGYFLNQGGLGACDNFEALLYPEYCEFERFFEDDVSRALDIEYYRVQIMFIKRAALDAVLVYFRILPQRYESEKRNISAAIDYLVEQVSTDTSPLYDGNVTIRIDPIWGVSNMQSIQTRRQSAPRFTLKYYEIAEKRLNNKKVMNALVTAYDRCKANRRCNWGIVELNQELNDAKYYQRLYDRGDLYETDLFLDFQDWRFGTRGFSWKGTISPTVVGTSSIKNEKVAKYAPIRGAHFWPFDLPSLGPDIPCFEKERNQGLVLDRMLQDSQIYKQEALVDDIWGRIGWLGENIEWASMDAHLRSRKDVRRHLTGVQAVYHDWWSNEVEELRELSSSQCSKKKCTITFDTSTLQLTGAINGTGRMVKTEFGTEVAVFTFNSIYLGPEVEVILIGQRALALISKTVAVINNTFHALPGTLGGFQGGLSVGRYAEDDLSDTPRAIPICQLNNYCRNESLVNESVFSNNVNGPGSGNLRVNSFVVKTSAEYIPEIQYITTSARDGQTLAGGFVIQFMDYFTPIIPHDCSAALMKSIIEDSLNLSPPKNAPVDTNRRHAGVAGVGLVTVSRSRQDTQEGFTWRITFSTAIGNIEQMSVTSYLQGLSASIVSGTVVEGNELGGFFRLDFQGSRTAPISIDETAGDFKAKLLQLPKVATAYVSRIDPTKNCDDGLCPYGPLPSRGIIWTVFVTTNASYDDVTPTSPRDPLSKVEGPLYKVTADGSEMTGINASVSVSYGLSTSPNDQHALLNIPKPFSLAYGGGGGSYGGLGGKGYGDNPVGAVYNDRKVRDLIGGSGGCMRSPLPFQINAVRALPTGRGGHGGGAIEIIASNDIIIGTYGKISMRGEDAEQSAEGGGGGGSGGAIVLASAGIVLNQGTLDVSGGSGGHGGDQFPELAGGGGSGGRIAIFGESITNTAKISVVGGSCGVKKQSVEVEVSDVTVRVHAQMLIPLDEERIYYLAGRYINDTLPGATELINNVNISTMVVNMGIDVGDVINCVVELSVILKRRNDAGVPYLKEALQSTFFETNFTNIGEVLMVHARVVDMTATTVSIVRSIPSTLCNNQGSAGSLYTEALMTTSMYVRETEGAEGTSRALYLSNSETTNTTSGSSREAPFALNGPTFPFNTSRPEKVSFYIKLAAVPQESSKSNFGALFSLITRSDPLLDVSNVIGVFMGYQMMHGANFGSAVDEKFFLKRLVTIDDYPTLSRWYKIDIQLKWNKKTYSVAIDNTMVALDQPFKANDLDGIRLSVTRATDVWFDEIYAGFDNTMSFTCPTTTRTGTDTVQPEQKHWSFLEVRGAGSIYTSYKKMTRHYSHVDTVGSIPFDGQGQVVNNQDLKLQFDNGDYPVTQGILHAGALVYVKNSLRSGKTPTGRSNTLVSPNGLWYQAPDGDVPGGAGDGRSFYYTEHNYDNARMPSLNGGVAACSSQDLIVWRFEGIVFHYTNLSDMVFGVNTSSFYVERPKVKFNEVTKQYVMWACMDNGERNLAMNAVMTSPYEDGPFFFRRSFYPDGNRTRDQVIFVNGDNKAVLGRTYFQTVEFVLPEAIMQPTWESVKDNRGSISFRANFHRSKYSTGYDNFHDIYIQRWRGEDFLWNVQCQNKLTKEIRQTEYGAYTAENTVCQDPEETKIVIGQGYPKAIDSKFISPLDPEYSFWVATSVPNVRSQPWARNYEDGYCGIRKLEDDLTRYDPALDRFTPFERNNCSNIADNPVHESLQDKLIGILKVVTTRRAKFMAISELTYDYLDTNGNMNSFEGELTSGDLISMIIEMGQFGFGAGTDIRSTAKEPVRPKDFDTATDYKTRFSQYITNYNDRALYSLACVLDGVCPVNYRDQLTPGNY